MLEKKLFLKGNLEVKIKLEGGVMPRKSTELAAAYDVYCPQAIELKHGRQVIDLGFSMELPHGYAAIIQSRSGFAAKGFLVHAMIRSAWCLLLGVFSKEKRIDADVLEGLVDEDYRDHVGVLVKSYYRGVFRRALIPKGTRIAQMRIIKIPETEIVEVDELDMSYNRGGGFGHTGYK